MCDVLLCVILTELAAAAAENCTTIAEKFRIFDQRMASALAIFKVREEGQGKRKEKLKENFTNNQRQTGEGTGTRGKVLQF